MLRKKILNYVLSPVSKAQLAWFLNNFLNQTQVVFTLPCARLYTYVGSHGLNIVFRPFLYYCYDSKVNFMISVENMRTPCVIVSRYDEYMLANDVFHEDELIQVLIGLT